MYNPRCILTLCYTGVALEYAEIKNAADVRRSLSAVACRPSRHRQSRRSSWSGKPGRGRGGCERRNAGRCLRQNLPGYLHQFHAHPLQSGTTPFAHPSAPPLTSEIRSSNFQFMKHSACKIWQYSSKNMLSAVEIPSCDVKEYLSCDQKESAWC